MGRQSSFNAVRPRWHRGQVGSRKSPHNLRIDYPVHAEGELHKERQPLASTWTMLKQSLSRILFQAPTPSYGPTDFPGELVWIPRTRWHSRPTSHPDDAAIPALLMRSPSARYLVVYFHCNGVDLGMCRGFCNVLRKQFRVHVLAVEYPGYGAWHAATTPETIVDAAGSALDFIVEHLQWPLDSVMIFGRSIGTGPAMAIAGNQPLAGLILVSPFLSIQELIRDRIGGLAGFCEDFFVSKDTAPKVKCPTFILHGEADEVVCNTHGKMLYKMLLSRKLLVMPAEMRHNSSLLGNLQHFVLPMFHFFSLPEQCTRELQVPIWAWHRRLVAQQAQHPVATRLLSEDFSVHDTSARDAPCEDCGEAVEVDSLSSKTTSESYSQQPAPPTMSTASWPEMLQPHRSSRVHFMRPRLDNDQDVCHWREDGQVLPRSEPPECVVAYPWSCVGQPIFTQDAPEMIDADVCLTSFSQLTNRKCFTCSACSCGQKQVVTKTWQENCKQTGTYQHRDATVRVSYSAVVNL